MKASGIPFAGDETAMLRGFLDHFRDTLQRQAAGLDATQLGQPLPPSTLSLGRLLAHLCFVEDHWFSVVLAGNDPDPEWRDVDWRASPDVDFDAWDRWSPDDLRARHRDFCARSEAALDAALATGGLDQLCARQRHGHDVSLRWVLVHMIEEYARHCGHADLIREALDGAVDL